LLFGIFVVIDPKNKIIDDRKPVLIGMMVLAIGICFGYNCGYAINPARDFGPRLFTLFIYGTKVFTADSYWFWVPIVAPLVGGTAGAGLHHLMFEVIKSPEEKLQDKKKQNELENITDMIINVKNQ